MSSEKLLVTVAVVTARQTTGQVLTLTAIDEVLYEERQLIEPVITAVKDSTAYRQMPILTFASVIVVAFWRGESYTLTTDTHAMYKDVEGFFQDICYAEDVRKIRVI